jgi:hypothetical protein
VSDQISVKQGEPTVRGYLGKVTSTITTVDPKGNPRPFLRGQFMDDLERATRRVTEIERPPSPAR